MDYTKLGFKAGLEIHQQLDTGKLFSGAPSFLRSDEPHYVIKRKLHAVAGESGEVDVAAAHEAAKDKEFYYEGYNDTISLVELDEEPPHAINKEALEIGLQIALLLNCEPYNVSQVMRKTVIDGSNTGGFQRTVLIAHRGFLETSFGRVPIDSVALEEDSARIVSKGKGKSVYRLDRLGIPLIEISTSPVMMNAEQVKEAALKIGEILRACKVKRGIGTIRQDVNVSIKEHDRVEIKGFQDPSMFVRTIDKEIARQMEDIKKKKTGGSVRNALSNGETEFLRPIPGAARMYPETDLPLLKIGLEQINKIKKNLPKLKGDIRAELRKKGLTEELISLVLESNEGLDEFTTLARVYSKDANLVAKMITLWRAEIASREKKTINEVKEILTERILEKLLEAVKEKKVEIGDVKLVMLKISNGEGFEEAIKIDKISDDKIEQEIREIVKEKPGLGIGGYMGLIIGRLGKDIDKKKAMEILQKVLK